MTVFNTYDLEEGGFVATWKGDGGLCYQMLMQRMSANTRKDTRMPMNTTYIPNTVFTRVIVGWHMD